MKEMIPYGLFPTYEKNIESEWKYNTFHVAHKFIDEFQSKVLSTINDDEIIWLNKDKQLMAELKGKGLTRDLDNIENLAKKDFLLKFQNGDVVRNVNEIFVLFQNKKWYNQEK